MHGRMPTLGAADRPWAANIARLCIDRIVLAFAIRLAHRMDWWQIHDVEAQRCNVFKLMLAVSKTGMLSRARPTRPWKEFIPRREPRTFAIDRDVKLVLGASSKLAAGIPLCDCK